MTAEGITIEEAGAARDGAGHFHVVADEACREPGATLDATSCASRQATAPTWPSTPPIPSPSRSVSDRDEWCAVIGEVDELFSATDNSDDEFAVKQVAYEQIGRLLAQLEHGLEHVDAPARPAVATSVGFAASLADALVAATDEQDAERRVEPLFAAGDEEEVGAGAPWILENCGIDIDA